MRHVLQYYDNQGDYLNPLNLRMVKIILFVTYVCMYTRMIKKLKV